MFQYEVLNKFHDKKLEIGRRNIERVFVALVSFCCSDRRETLISFIFYEFLCENSILNKKQKTQNIHGNQIR